MTGLVSSAPAGEAPSAAEASRAGDVAVFERMRRNLGWLLGGRGFQAVASLFYLSLAARALGPERFGEFTLALAYGQAIANIAQFQSWQGVIRYGALHLARANERRLSRLLGFTATLDVASALTGALLAFVGVMAVGPWLGWSDGQQGRAAIFGAALLLSIGATPTGILRLLDRFDLIVYAQAISPTVRLAGAIMGWALGGGVGLFLGVWAAAALLQSAATWIIALSRAGRRLALGPRRFRIATRENEGIWRFMLITNLSSTLGLLTEQVGTLAVGGVAGATMAGGYRMAAKLAKAVARPVQMMATILYPELARLKARRDTETLNRVMTRTLAISALLALVLIAVVVLLGPLLIRLLGGRSYEFARIFLIVLGIGAALDLSGFALEPLLTSQGRPGRVLAIRISGSATYFALLAILLPVIGPLGAAMAVVAAALVVRVRLGREARACLTEGNGPPP